MFDKMFKDLTKQADTILKEALKQQPTSTNAAAPTTKINDTPTTRWEKAVMGLNGIVGQVSKIDPDGVDVFCFPGMTGDGADIDTYRNVKDVRDIEALVTSKTLPSGPCQMGKALDTVLNEAFERGFDKRPCSILVLTAGRPDDHEYLTNRLAEAADKVGNNSDLTITFVQVGDDPEATKYLKHLDDNLTTTSADGKAIDIIDTIKDEEIQKAVGDLNSHQSGTAGALMGAFAGAAMGVGGVYLYNKINANKRTQGWNGQWKVTFEGDEIATVTVVDDMKGNLTIEGFPDMQGVTGQYAAGASSEASGGGLKIQQNQPNDPEPIYGTIEDEHSIAWTDGTRWEEIPPKGAHWSHYAGAAAVGAAASGTAGYLLQKKFFKKASNKVPSDYVIVLDRSHMMAILDTGK